jgi:hypothetical protein
VALPLASRRAPRPGGRRVAPAQPQPARDVVAGAHCGIPWEMAETSLVDPAGKDACGVSVSACCAACGAVDRDLRDPGDSCNLLLRAVWAVWLR